MDSGDFAAAMSPNKEGKVLVVDQSNFAAHFVMIMVTMVTVFLN